MSKPTDLRNQFLLRDRKRRRRSYVLVGIASALSLALLGGVFWLVARSGKFSVNEVAIHGLRRVTTNEVRVLIEAAAKKKTLLSRFVGLDNILAWPDEFDEHDLKDIPLLAELNVRKDYAQGRVDITVFEKEPVGAWCRREAEREGGDTEENNAFCFWFDSRGVLLDEAPFIEGSLIPRVDDHSSRPIRAGAFMIEERFLPALFSLFEVLRASGLGIEAVRFERPELEEVRVNTYGGPALYFSLRFAADGARQVLPLLAARPEFEKLEYVDFRVENRAYYR